MTRSERLDEFIGGMAEVLGAFIGRIAIGFAYGIGAAIAVKLMFHL